MIKRIKNYVNHYLNYKANNEAYYRIGHHGRGQYRTIQYSTVHYCTVYVWIGD